MNGVEFFEQIHKSLSAKTYIARILSDRIFPVARKNPSEVATNVIIKRTKKNVIDIIHELDALSKLRGTPEIVTYHGLIEDDTTFNLFFERMNGDLEHYQRAINSFPNYGTIYRENIETLTASMLRALAKMETMGCQHLDIKPKNILWGGTVEDPIFKLCDFGSTAAFIQKAIGENEKDLIIDRLAMPVYTANYRPPEYVIGWRRDSYKQGANFPPASVPSYVSDVWALGITLYELIEMKPFFKFNLPPVGDAQRDVAIFNEMNRMEEVILCGLGYPMHCDTHIDILTKRVIGDFLNKRSAFLNCGRNFASMYPPSIGVIIRKMLQGNPLLRPRASQLLDEMNAGDFMRRNVDVDVEMDTGMVGGNTTPPAIEDLVKSLTECKIIETIALDMIERLNTTNANDIKNLVTLASHYVFDKHDDINNMFDLLVKLDWIIYSPQAHQKLI